MPWIQSHIELKGHPKTKRFFRRLGIPRVTAIGHLHELWWWALEYAQDGQLAHFSDEEVAEACDWEGDPAVFRRALTASGFLDDCGAIHDWDEYTARLMEQRAQANAKAKERMRRMRARRAEEAQKDEEERNAQVSYAAVTGTRSRNERNVTPLEKRTVDNRREEERTTPPKGGVAPASTASAPDADPFAGMAVLVPAQAKRTRAIDPLWEALKTIWPDGGETDGERGKWNTALGQLRKIGATPEEVLLCARNWPNVMSDATMTAMGIVNNWGTLKSGPQVNGRSRGVTQEVRQRLTQSAVLRPSPSEEMAQARARRDQGKERP